MTVTSVVYIAILAIIAPNYVLSQLSASNSQCISADTTIYCVTLHSTTFVNYMDASSGSPVYPDQVFPYFCNAYGGGRYYYYHYRTDQIDSQSLIIWPSSTHCFDVTDTNGACINIAYNPATITSIGQSDLYHFEKWSATPQIVSIPVDKTPLSFINYSRTSITKYRPNAQTQCIEILSARFPSTAQTNYLFGDGKYYFIQGYMLRSNSNAKLTDIGSEFHVNKQDPARILKVSTTSDQYAFNPTFNQLFCFANTASSDASYVHIALQVATYFAPDTLYSFEYIVVDSARYQQAMDYQVHLVEYNDSSTYLNLRYWQRCESATSETDTDSESNGNSGIKTVHTDAAQDYVIATHSRNLSSFSMAFLVLISVVAVLIIIAVSVLSITRFPAGDPINYFSLIWIVLELWDFWSDISFTIYLFIISRYYAFPFSLLGILSLICVVVPYALNIVYFRHLINLWSKQPHCCKAPQSWLMEKKYYLYFLIGSLVTGGSFPAIELTNSVLIPHPLFCCGVPYFELVRICFYFAIKGLHSDTLDDTVGGFVFLGTVLSSILSVLFSGTYFFSYKGKAALPIAVYTLEVTLECDECEQYWKYSIWRMQTAISKAFQVSSPTLIVIDSCDISYVASTAKYEVAIRARLLYDDAPFGNKSNIRALLSNKNDHSVTSDLAILFKKEFQLHKIQKNSENLPSHARKKSSNVWLDAVKLRVSHCVIHRIDNGDGELMYDYTQSLLKTLCCWICHRGKPQISGLSTREMMMRYRQQRQGIVPSSSSSNNAHIRNVSEMKAAYSKHHKSSDGDISFATKSKPSVSSKFGQKGSVQPLSPASIQAQLNAHQQLSGNRSEPRHHRIQSNPSRSAASGHAARRRFESNTRTSNNAQQPNRPLPPTSPSGSQSVAVKPVFSPHAPITPYAGNQSMQQQRFFAPIQEEKEEQLVREAPVAAYKINYNQQQINRQNNGNNRYADDYYDDDMYDDPMAGQGKKQEDYENNYQSNLSNSEDGDDMSDDSHAVNRQLVDVGQHGSSATRSDRQYQRFGRFQSDDEDMYSDPNNEQY